MTKNIKKKKKPRNKVKYPNLDPSYNLKSRRDYIETDYIHGVESVTGQGEGIRAMTEEEKKWLNKFNGEYVNASVSQSKKESQLHNTEELVKDCYNRNNARNRCVFNKAKMLNKLENIDWDIYNKKDIMELTMDELETIQNYITEMTYRKNDKESKKILETLEQKLKPHK